MMKVVLSRAMYRILAGLLPAAMTISATASAADADRPTRRAAPERAVGGLTVEQQAARQIELSARLTREMPRGAMKSPIRVELTPQDRADLAVPANANGPAPLRIGVVKSITPRIGVAFGEGFQRGATQKTRDGGFTWAVAVTSPEAQAIRVHFTNFSLPPNVEMYFFSPNGQAHGPYVGLGRNGNGDFWTRSINSETGVIQLRVSGRVAKADRKNISFAITDLGHIHGRRMQAARGAGPSTQSHDSWPCSDNAPCLVDANCVNVSQVTAAKDAVAKMEWIQGPFINTCSGGLLADTDTSTQIPYFLTANHCFTSSNSSLETFFFYTTDSCNGACPDSLVTGGTPPPASTIGVTVVATGSAGDYNLLTLDEPPPAGAVFLGWNNSPIANTDGAKLYRISNANFGPQVYSQHNVDATATTCTSWPRGERIYSADQTGATMGGSSGSPVLNSAGEVVGQLSGCCGFNCADECDSASNSTVDGALAFYWDQVSAFLDPPAGCTTDLECDDGLFCTGTETCVGGSCQSSGDPCTGGTTCNESTNTCDAPACNNDGACGPGEDCNNCPNDCRAKLNGNPNGRYCCDGDLPNCGDTRCSESGWICGTPEVCGNGTCGSGEDVCNCPADCGAPGAEICNNGTDDDCDGFTDCSDPDCTGDPACQGCNLGQRGDPCNSGADCCSGQCKRNGTCK